MNGKYGNGAKNKYMTDTSLIKKKNLSAQEVRCGDTKPASVRLSQECPKFEAYQDCTVSLYLKITYKRLKYAREV